MNKRAQIILFVVVVSLGIFLIDSFLFGQLSEDEECNCYDSQAVWAECNAVCMGFGGCDVPWLYQPGETLSGLALFSPQDIEKPIIVDLKTQEETQ